MADIHHDLWIKANEHVVFDRLCRSPGLDQWWTLSSDGHPEQGAEYRLFFGEDYDWRAVVSQCRIPHLFEWTMTRADDDWKNTRVHFELSKDKQYTRLRFSHLGWPEVNDHFRRSSYCWAMYLRALKRYIEDGEITSYATRTSL